jgi:hypothetical protein
MKDNRFQHGESQKDQIANSAPLGKLAITCVQLVFYQESHNKTLSLFSLFLSSFLSFSFPMLATVFADPQ